MSEDDGSPGRSRRARWWGLVRLGVRRTVARAGWMTSRQLGLTVAGIAVSVALLLLITSVALGLAIDPGVSGTQADYWVVPEGSAGSVVTPVEGQRLGDVHRATGRFERTDGVTYATPVLAALLPVKVGNETVHVLAVGVIPDADQGTVFGLRPDGLTTGDPLYANGSYNGQRTGEMVLSTEAATLLGRSTGDGLTVDGGRSESNRSFVVVATQEGRTAGVGQLPVALVHLSELQTITGAADADSAGRLLVGAAGPGVEDRLDDVYPGSTVLTRTELLRRQTTGSQLPVAISAAALLIAVVIGTLFVVTTMGFELTADSRHRTVLTTLGVSRRSLALLVVVQTLAVATLGGIAGVLLWLVGVWVSNAAATSYLTGGPVARIHPVLPVYGMAVAVLVGGLAVPYLLVLGRRTVDMGKVRA